MKASLIVFSLMLYHSLSFGSDHYLSDEQIRHLLVAESIRIFPGKCPCPYSLEKKKSCFGKNAKSGCVGEKVRGAERLLVIWGRSVFLPM